MHDKTLRPSLVRRACALLALLVALAGPAVVIALLITHPVQVVIAVVLIAIALTAAWSALVHRGVWRVIATIVAVVALGAPLALPDVRAYLVAVLYICLAVLAVALARVAIGHRLAPVARMAEVGPARHGVLLMNRKSGGGKVEKFALEAEARKRGLRPVVLRPGDDLGALAERAAAAGADVLGMAGGDGSQALVADVARRHGIPFVCVPAGTRNHLALDLGLDRDDVVAALDAYGDAYERTIDLAMLGDRVFVNNASLGVYAAVVQSEGYRDAKLSSAAAALPDLLGPTGHRPDLRFTRPDGTDQSGADVVLISNGPYRLEHLNGFGSRERMDTGELGVVTVSVNRATEVPVLVTAEMSGRLSRFPGYRAWSAREFVVTSGQPLVEVGVDGEALRLPPPLHFRSLPGALRVRLPKSAPRVSPSAAAPVGAGKVIGALLAVLAGRPDPGPAGTSGADEPARPADRDARGSSAHREAASG